MRKLAMASALAAALAWTGARAEDAQKKQAEANQEVSKAKAQAHEDVSKAQADAQKDVAKAQADAQKKEADARQDASKESAHAQGAMGSDKHPVFTKDNFEMKGKVASASSSSITLHREGLPDAKLDVDRNTKIELDGNHVSAGQLQPGQDVKASFNLKDDKPMAVEIKAKKGAAKSSTERSTTPSTTPGTTR
jgi:colicin import membrane protein